MKKIRTKIWAGFGIVVLLAGLLGANSIFGIQKIAGNSKEMINEELPAFITESRLAFNITERVALARGYIIHENEQYIEDFNRLSEISEELEKELLQNNDTTEVKALIARTTEWHNIMTEAVFPALKEGDRIKAEFIDQKVAEPIANEIIRVFDQIAMERQEAITAEGNNALKIGSSVFLTNVILSIAVIVLALIISSFVARSLARPIISASKRIDRMSEGILNDPPIQSKLKDEVGQQIQSINKMSEQLRETLSSTLTISHQLNEQSSELTKTSEMVNDSANQIAATMEQLAAGTESQANTASEMAEMVGSFFEDVQQTNEAGRQVTSASRTILQKTAQGNDMMSSSVQQMGEIFQVVNDSVQTIKQLDEQAVQISSLITVISDIAEQTNLLALNAAIEAARAGEHGKGFAVVANEVKKLAEQVADSVNEITEIVTDVQNGSSRAVAVLESGYTSVESGKQTITDTGVLFDEITDLITEMSNLTEGMSESLRQLEETGGMLTAGVSEVASIAEQSAAGVQETTASTEQTTIQMERMRENAKQLEDLSNALSTSVGRFTI